MTGTSARSAATTDTGIAPFTKTTKALLINPSVTSGTPATRRLRAQNAAAHSAEVASPTT